MAVDPGEDLIARSAAWPSLTLGRAELATYEVLAGGGFPPLDTYMAAADVIAVREGRPMTDGTDFPAAVALEVPEPVARPLVGRTVALRHPEGVLLAGLDVREADPTGATAADGTPLVALTGTLEVALTGVHYDHPDLRTTPSQLADLGPFAVLASGTVLGTAAIDATLEAARGRDLPVLLQTLVGSRAPDDYDLHTLVRAHRILADRLREEGLDVVHVLVPLTPPGAPAEGEGAAGLLRVVAAASGGVAVHVADPEPASVGALPEPIADLLDRRVPGPGQVGVTLLFSGLSGSGKSTVAGAVMARIHAESDRRVTLLDGDLVRQHLSSELGFSREHRDLNVTRIGMVAAEVTKHGGIAICAPIAPYAATRAVVREMVEAVGRMVLVHVATPLEVCEARDRKGLYAMARRGEIESFTGISDVYEVPEDAELRIDTSAMDVAEAAEVVMAHLRAQGMVPEAVAPGAPATSSPASAPRRTRGVTADDGGPPDGMPG